MNAREIAYYILFHFEQEKGKLHELISNSLTATEYDLRDGEKKYISHLCSGVVRNLSLIDWKLSGLYDGDYKRMLNKIKSLLRLALYELDYMDFIPPHATVNEVTTLARKKINSRAAAQVNGILRTYLREKGRFDPERKFKYIETQLAVKYSFPEWMIKRWINLWGEEETRQLCAAFNERPYFDLRINLSRVTSDDFIQILNRNNIEFRPSAVFPQVVKVYDLLKITKLKLFEQGLCSVQDESSLLVLELLQLDFKGWIVDVCAAPGGKLTAILEREKSGLKVIGLDRDLRRLNRLQENCQRLGLQNYNLLQNDATVPAFRTEFEQILIDAPCSGLGSIQKHPDIKWRRSWSEILEFQELQLKILQAQAKLIKTGGFIVYSTCTIEPAENEGVVEKFLELHKDRFEIDRLPERLRLFSRDNTYLRTFPHHHQMDGSFAVRLRKKQ